MTEAQFLDSNSAEFDRLAAEIDALLAKATDQSWQATNLDNGWTTAQIVEHLWRTTEHYQDRVAGALAKAPPSNGALEVKFSFFARMILKGLGKRKTPAPKMLIVAESIDPRTATEHWDRLKKSMREELETAKGKSLTSPRFSNPFIPFFSVSFAEYVELQNEHLRYHIEQIARRIPA